jgi:hypothetical protein
MFLMGLGALLAIGGILYMVVREQASKRLSGSLFFGCGGI